MTSSQASAPKGVLRELRFSAPGRRQEQDPARLDRAAWFQGAAAERLQCLQAPERLKPLAAAVQRQQAALLERLGLEFPEWCRAAGGRAGPSRLSLAT